MAVILSSIYVDTTYLDYWSWYGFGRAFLWRNILVDWMVIDRVGGLREGLGEVGRVYGVDGLGTVVGAGAGAGAGFLGLEAVVDPTP